MKEIEILVDFEDESEAVLKKLSKYELISENYLYDIYFYENDGRFLPMDDLRINEILRLRRLNDNQGVLTYKKNNFEGRHWTYSDEYECICNSFDNMNDIMRKLGYKELIVVNNHRREYKFNDIIIVFDEIIDNKLFVEIEYLTNDDVDIFKVKNELWKFFKKLKFKNPRVLNIGKNQILLAKKLGIDINLYNDEFK